MRDTIDFGIDLGTTNSAIAVANDGAVTVIKNGENADTTPSAVWLPRAGMIEVGRRARDRMENDPDNATAEFKLEMGLADAGRHFAKADVTLSPQQLSAEVLKSLRADAAGKYKNEPAPRAAVITVPAAFSLNQNKATSAAAALAGFSPACPLVQEPTAAAFAYGFHNADERAYWLVFDFGGGTFDAAVVSKRDGDLRVLNHAGDSYLGGKLIDWALVERVLAPAAARELGLTDFRRNNQTWRNAFAKLKRAAEDAKIELSRKDSVNMMAELALGDGDTDAFEFTLRRDQVDELAEPYYVRAINLCRTALTDSGLGPADIDKLLLVGGVTLAPGLRERLADPDKGLGIELDVSLDPTTVVACGAAIFASTVRQPDPPSFRPAAGEFSVKLAYEPAVTITTPPVAGRLHSAEPVDWTGFSVVLSNPTGKPPFRTARIALNRAGAFATEVDVDQHKTSHFVIELFDAEGTPRKLTPNTLSITHRDVEFGGARLTHSLGIELADRAFSPLLRKGAGVPTQVREVFRTSGTLRRADADAVIRIPVVQGERLRADRNRSVGTLEIRPGDVRIDLPAGSEIEVTFEIDSSNLVTVVADVPLIPGRQFEAEIDLDNVRAPSPAVLAEILSDAERRLTAARDAANATGSADAEVRLARLDEERTLTTAREQVRAAGTDVGAAATAEDRLRDLHAELDDIEEAANRPALVRDLQDSLADASELVERSGDSGERQELSELKLRAQEAIDKQDSIAIRAQLDRVSQFLVRLESHQPGWAVKLFYALIEQQDILRPASQAQSLIREGHQALAARDERALTAVNQRLVRLLPQDEQGKVFGLVKP
ncbi:MAG: molecular chaperone DnaK [Kribbellaceae bacterium]|nr:molecular chaperone DnaK [Kribbellaceae bacterium]